MSELIGASTDFAKKGRSAKVKVAITPLTRTAKDVITVIIQGIHHLPHSHNSFNEVTVHFISTTNIHPKFLRIFIWISETLSGKSQAVKFLILLSVSCIPDVVPDIKEYDYDQISCGKLLGHGSFGTVHLVELNGEKIAVKHFKSSDPDDLVYFSKNNKESWLLC
jgi:hypothetical protein